MGMKKLNEMCQFLGPMYFVKIIDGVESIFRKINDKYEFEITGFLGRSDMCIYLWRRQPHTELMAIYSGIKTKEHLADALGYLSFKYQNLSTQIQVERED